MKLTFKAIAAMSENRVIGNGNKIPWHLPEDFKWFKKMTTGQIIVMGRKTFESIGKPLPNRTTIVLSRTNFQYPGVQTISDLSELKECGLQGLSEKLDSGTGVSPVRTEAVFISETHGRDARATTEATRSEDRAPAESKNPAVAARDVFICGGAQIYEQTLPHCSDLYLTLVKRTVEGDTFFPAFENQFELVEEIRDCADFKILHYKRL